MSRQYKQNAAKKRLKFMPSSYKFKLVLFKSKGPRAQYSINLNPSRER